MSDELDVPEAGDGVAAEVLKFLAVQGKLLALKAQTAALSSRVKRVQRQMEDDAAEARVLVDMCGQAEVAEEYMARIEEVAANLLGVSQAAATVSSAADAASLAADTTQAEHRAEYHGIYEQSKLSKHPMAKPAFYRTR